MEVIYETLAEYSDWFYLVTVLWAFLEGESFVILAGAASYHGALNLPLLIISAWIGSFSGDQFYFFLGRRYGQRMLDRYPRWRGGVDQALRLLHDYHIGFILSFRFIYGVRNVASFAVGMSEVRWMRFVMLNFIAAGLWATTFAGAGFLLAKAFEAVLGELARTFGLVMLAVFLIAAWVVLRVHRRRQERQNAAAQAMEPEPIRNEAGD